ncbi:MAG: hypothetical protein ACOCT7_02865, partial [Candidatus Saliniplasma sp.]
YYHLVRSNYDALDDLASDVEEKLEVDLSPVKDFIKHYNDENLIDGKSDEDTKPSISGGIMAAIKARVSSDKMPDESIYTVNEPIDKDKLQDLSERIYGDEGKKIFFVSDQKKWDGRISVELEEYRQKFQLMQVFKNKEGQLFYKHFGEGVPNKGYNKIDTHTQSFYVYKFVSDDKQYLMLSREKLNPMRCEVSGMLYKVNDAKQVGDQARLPTNQDIIFVNKVEPAIKTMDSQVLLNMAKEIDISHNWLADKMFGIWRHPEWFEKLLIAVKSTSDEFGYPSHIIWFGPPGTGKSKLLTAIKKSFGEQHTVFSGTRSTIKGLTPSFKNSPPSEGYLLKTQRVATVDELFNLLSNVENKEDLFRNLLDILEHETRTFGSGNGSIRGKMEATMIAAGNPSYGFDTVVEAARELDSAFLSRNILYDMTDRHIDYIENREALVKKKKAQGEKLYPEMDEQLISIFDTLCEEIRIPLDYDKLSETKEDVGKIVPSGKDIQDVYRARALHHIENLTAGIAKINSLIEKRGEFKIVEKDYKEAKTIFEMVISSWRDGVSLENLSLPTRVMYLKPKTREVYDVIDYERQMAEDELVEKFDEPINYELGRLKSYDLVKEIEIKGKTMLAPYWHDGKDYS